MRQILVILLTLLLSALWSQKYSFASCYSVFNGKYDDKNISIAVKTSSSSGKSNVGFYSSQRIYFHLTGKSQPLSDVKIIYGNVVFKLDDEGKLSIPIASLNEVYEIELIYSIPNPENKDENAPHWKKFTRVNYSFRITQARLSSCHQIGTIKIRKQ